jgi:hypothetical protein
MSHTKHQSKKTPLTLTLAAALFLSGCATSTYVVNNNSNDYPEKEDMQNYFVSGLGQKKEMNAAEICGGADKVAKVVTHTKFIDGFLGAITMGLYTPRTAKVYCIKP